MKKNDPTGLPPSVGKFLRGYIENVFEQIDVDGSGEITTSEFVDYRVTQAIR